ncbi:murein L,D-transpeptidase catalytic domain family protein [Hymenobacter cellulosilyticus]|uniref:Murein L,D-transpeptidase catalytic domain family protein n=1 Tax=Hymenobacter cellulosilyticus TaxID=2932248 RepID=A0A8T9Q1L2_9BACT|nr:murein L,D-transpeptidase catalytic domain family protein [Hymenobacter cellulosilyticus]UOQ70792.1 murein L,D-transpeptidase catalytic domain family protein [Hymenobacter cellulosilyticus]
MLTALSFLAFAAPATATDNPRSTQHAAASANAAARKAFYTAAFEQHMLLTYTQSGLTQSGLSLSVFRQALIGYYNLQQRGLASTAKPLLTVIDFSRSSRLKRLWVIDLKKQRVLFHTLVAHGKNTGEEFAKAFSNKNGSEQSSIGFYVTGNTYTGKHGLSLKLQGLEPRYNSNAASRAVVVHGAEYVCEDFVRQHGRLGRSQGCPALPTAQASSIIRAIKGGSVIYAHAPATVNYTSSFLQLDPALTAFARTQGIAKL